jgi:hypothetical protein
MPSAAAKRRRFDAIVATPSLTATYDARGAEDTLDDWLPALG